MHLFQFIIIFMEMQIIGLEIANTFSFTLAFHLYLLEYMFCLHEIILVSDIIYSTIWFQFIAKLNYPVKITRANARKQYTYAIEFMRYLGLSLSYSLFYVLLKSIQIAGHSSVELSGSIGIEGIFLLLGPITMIITVYLYFAFTNK